MGEFASASSRIRQWPENVKGLSIPIILSHDGSWEEEQSPIKVSYLAVTQKRRTRLTQLRLLDDHAARNCEDVTTPDIPAEEFFEEIIRTYRLLFGQDEKSWKAFAHQVPTLANPTQTAPAIWACDPLLYVLCGISCTSAEATEVYDDLDSSPQANCYDPCSEFPFFGKRLMELQQFVKQHQPQNLKALMSDRRDVGAWLNLWSTQVSNFGLMILSGSDIHHSCLYSLLPSPYFSWFCLWFFRCGKSS